METKRKSNSIFCFILKILTSLALLCVSASANSCSNPKTYIASASLDKTIKIWDLEQGARCIITLEGHEAEVSDMKTTSDHSLLITSSYDRMIKIWSVETGRCLLTIKSAHDDLINTIDISHDDRYIASGGDDKTIKIWNITDGSLVLTKNFNFAINVLKYTPDDLSIIAAEGSSIISASGYLAVWDLREGGTKNLLRKIHDNKINDFSFSPDGKVIFTISIDQTVKVLDMNFSVLQSLLFDEKNDFPSRIFSFNGILISGVISPNIYFYSWDNVSLKYEKKMAVSKTIQGPIHRFKQFILTGSQSMDGELLLLNEEINENMATTLTSHSSMISSLVSLKRCMKCQTEWSKYCSDCYMNIDSCQNCELGVYPLIDKFVSCSSAISFCKNCVLKSGKPFCLSCYDNLYSHG
jgi:WD40 repeat protein